MNKRRQRFETETAHLPSPSLSLSLSLSDVDAALARALLYNVLALGFRAPTEETTARLFSDESAAALRAAGALLEERAGRPIAPATRALGAIGGASAAELSSSHRRLFGHTARGLVPPYETEYGVEALFQQSLELADLAGFYRAFGLAVNAAERERADHVSCECEFLSFLALKEAYALENGEPAMLEETRKAARLFLRDHLARFAPAFSRKLARDDRDGFYGRLGELCRSLVEMECVRLGVPAGPENLALRPANDERVPMACGAEGGCPVFPGGAAPDGTD